jgi:uncharacterized protein (TIGR00645 family)
MFSTGLKLKLLLSVMAIPAIEALKAFMDLKNISDRDLAIHLVFAETGIIEALTDRISESGHTIAKERGSPGRL